MAGTPADAFSPARAIDDPARFAGRRAELDNLSDALLIPGGHIVIYGNRGIGKSSLAQQLMLLAQGSELVLEKLKHRPDRLPDFLPVYLQCDDSIKSLDGLLLRLLTTDSALAGWLPYSVTAVTSEGQLGGQLSVKVLTLSAGAKSSTTYAPAVVPQDLRSVFINSLNAILASDPARDGILLVIDEFDRLGDRTGLASVMKSLDDRIKMVLVGVSTNVAELITEHESIARQLANSCVFVQPMTKSEVSEIFRRAEKILGGSIVYDSSAVTRVDFYAKGHPFLVQLLGYQATVQAQRTSLTNVDASVIDNVLNDIASKSSAPIQEELYRKAVGHSYTREIILREFASISDDEIRTTPVYAAAAQKLGMPDPNAISVYMGHLTSERYGAAIVKTRDRHYRFKDSLFKAYAAARPMLMQPGTIEED